ncbi:general substrate transporter [Pseudomassariella vexata]|uniref:General substrate transporter n=1 Tax=Pseudomassariella vexata TaxID=1141098 RepID=A0A1Y2D9C2_9PEZI|nr:general substrate transporter [Pseudomassariella vexata]ORY55853.1 general substrate transporter [Pseudomassariella vexata]
MADQIISEKATRPDFVESGEPGYTKFQHAELHDKVLNEEARLGTEQEHAMGLAQALKTHKRAAMWSILISMTVVMEGYDVTLLGNFFGYPAFRKKYGVWTNEKDGYQITAPWQAGLNDISGVGNIIGALLNGYLTAKYGHRKVIMGSLVFLSAFIFMTFFAPNITVQLLGQFFCNIPWGVFATTGPAYAAEVAPLALRGYLTAYINLCWCMGQFISAGVLKGLVNNETDWSYKIPFAVQWVWPIPLFIAALLAPESPWYLVRTGQLERARRSLERLSQPEHNINYDSTIALMVHTDKLEKEERSGVTFYDAFRGTNRRRTEIACMAFLSQITDGGALCYSGTFFFQQTGISADASYAIGLAGTAIGFCGTLISWLYIAKWGRRTIWLYGFYVLVTVLFIIGILACVPKQTVQIAWAQSCLCLVWLGAYSMSVGPIVFTIVAEIGSTRLRTQTVVLGRATYYIGNIIGGVLQPYFMSPTAWNAKGKTAFFWGSLSFLTTVWGFFRLPETKDRTFAEMDFMFQKGVPARKFASYKIDQDEEFLARD